MRDWLCAEPLPGFAALRVIRIVWGSLMLLTAINLMSWNYLIATSSSFFRLPLAPGLICFSPILHAMIVISLLPASVCVIANLSPRLASAAVAFGMMYCLTFDYFAFHHGWVLLLHISVLLVFLLTPQTKRAAVCCLRALIVVVYLTAGLNKLNASFLRGEVVEELIQQQWRGSALWDLLVALPHGFQAIAIGAAISEVATGVLLVPRRTRPLAYLIGSSLHFGILMLTKAGLILNVYMPASYLFFCWNERVQASVALPRGRLAALLPKLDWNQRIHWLEPSDEMMPVIPRATALVRDVPLLNPLFLVFAAMTLGLWAEFLPNAIRGFAFWRLSRF